MLLVFFPSVVNEEAKAIIIFVHGDSVQEASCRVPFCLLRSGGTCAAREDGWRPLLTRKPCYLCTLLKTRPFSHFILQFSAYEKDGGQSFPVENPH